MPLQDTAFTPATGFRDASAYPNPASGTAARDQFQDGLDQLRDEVNNKVIAPLNSTTSGSSGAENVGSATIPGITGNTVHAQVSNLLAIAQAAQAGDILPGTVTETMLAFSVATQAELNTTNTNLTTHQNLTTHKGGLIYAYKNLGGGL